MFKTSPLRQLASGPARCRVQRVQFKPAALMNLFNKSNSSSRQSKEALGELLRLVDGTERGLRTPPQVLQQIKQCFDTLEELDQASGKVVDSTATWRLLWTTEKETLFILKNAGLFRTTAGEVYQVVDTAAGTLQNVIEFPPDGAFIVDSAIQQEGERRVNFQFNGASLKTAKRTFRLPPKGKGWFDNVYVDSEYRLSKDVRGDYLLVQRVGPPRRFE